MCARSCSSDLSNGILLWKLVVGVVSVEFICDCELLFTFFLFAVEVISFLCLRVLVCFPWKFAMRDLANKMAELKFEAPLAKFEETDEWGPVDYQSSNATLKAAISDALNLNIKENENLYLLEEAIKDNCNSNDMKKIDGGDGDAVTAEKTGTLKDSLNCNNVTTKDTNTIDNFADAFSGSLEDLVNTFDEKITKCFGNYEQSVEELAPVQVRSQEEIMNECQ